MEDKVKLKGYEDFQTEIKELVSENIDKFNLYDKHPDTVAIIIRNFLMQNTIGVSWDVQIDTDFKMNHQKRKIILRPLFDDINIETRKDL